MAIGDFFKNMFGSKERSVLGIDIGTSSIKVVQLRKKKGRAVLETYGEIALGPYADLKIGQATNLSPLKIVEALQDLLKESNTSTQSVGLSIPFRSSLVSLIEMPALSEKQLAEMIPIEARKYIPVPISEVTLDWWVVPKPDSAPMDDEKKDEKASDAFKKKTDVLVVSIHNEILSNFGDIVKNSHLNASFFEIEMFSSTRALINQEANPIMVFDMGASGTKIYIVEHGVIKISHIINKGSQDITSSISTGLNVSWEKAEHIKRNINSLKEEDQKAIEEIIALTVDYIFSEASSVLINYQKKYTKAVGKIILTGGGIAQKGLLEMAKKAFETEVEYGDPFSKVETPAFLANALKMTGLEFAVAIGIALRKLQEVE